MRPREGTARCTFLREDRKRSFDQRGRASRRFGASFVSAAILLFVAPHVALTGGITGGNSAAKNRRPDSGPVEQFGTEFRKFAGELRHVIAPSKKSSVGAGARRLQRSPDLNAF